MTTIEKQSLNRVLLMMMMNREECLNLNLNLNMVVIDYSTEKDY